MNNDQRAGVNRYHTQMQEIGDATYLHPEGEYVLYTDHAEALRQERERAEKAEKAMQHMNFARLEVDAQLLKEKEALANEVEALKADKNAFMLQCAEQNAEIAVLVMVLHSLKEACHKADAEEELSEHIDGSLLDKAAIVLDNPKSKEALDVIKALESESSRYREALKQISAGTYSSFPIEYKDLAKAMMAIASCALGKREG